MATEEELRERARSLTFDDLCDLWMRVKAKETPEWAEGKALEYLIVRAFELEGASVRWPYQVRLEGSTVEQIDGFVYLGSQAFLLEAKDVAAPISFGPIAKLRAILTRRPVTVVGVIFSMSDFTRPAKVLAAHSSPQTVLLWERPEIESALLEKRMFLAMKQKHRHCLEHGIPDFDTRAGRYS